MDPVAEIKSRLPIDELVGRYCQLQKKGRNLVALCPFHNDSHPSFLVSPDKGIAYCFACQSGGDIFTFYQKIEGVDFVQALKDLAERAGVTLPDRSSMPVVKKGEKDRARECLDAALAFFREQLPGSALARDYLAARGVPPEQVELFQIGVAPDSFTATYDHLLKKGFSRSEILAAGLGVQRDLQDERIYDRFRHRLMFPILDAQGRTVAFGGRTLGDDDAKYINSSETLLYRKSAVLYGFHLAKDRMREEKVAVLVEGYFDVLACHRVGVANVVATSGTALTEEHAKILQRSADRVRLCLDQDAAGRAAAERAFLLLAAAGVQVESVLLPAKDPGDMAQSDPEEFARLLRGGEPYLDSVLREVAALDLGSQSVRRTALERVLTLAAALPYAVERSDFLDKAARSLRTTASALEQDLQSFRRQPETSRAARAPEPQRTSSGSAFSAVEVALGLFLFYPALRQLLAELLPPPEGSMAVALYRALKEHPETPAIGTEHLDLPPDHRERVAILHLYLEEHGFGEWSEGLAVREIRRNCHAANREIIKRKQEEITQALLKAREEGRFQDEALLSTQYQQVLKLAKLAP